MRNGSVDFGTDCLSILLWFTFNFQNPVLPYHNYASLTGEGVSCGKSVYCLLGLGVFLRIKILYGSKKISGTFVTYWAVLGAFLHDSEEWSICVRIYAKRKIGCIPVAQPTSGKPPGHTQILCPRNLWHISSDHLVTFLHSTVKISKVSINLPVFQDLVGSLFSPVISVQDPL